MEFVNELGLLALGSRMRALSDRLYGIADEVYAQRGIAIQGRWFPVLRLLHDRGPRTVGEIAEAIGQTHSAISQLADKLVEEGWLEAVTDARDKRRRRLGLTAKTEAVLRDVKPAWRAIQETLAERCRVAGVDILDALGKFGKLMDPSITLDIVARAQAIERVSVRVLPFEPGLRAHFYRLNAEWLEKYFYIEEIDHQVLAEPETEILARGGAVFFALLGEVVVGTCALKLESQGSYELTKMAVDERYQGLGIGRRLIEAAIAEYQHRGGVTLFLETSTKLEPAIRLYESVGFVRQSAPKPDSHYQRANVYMVWRAPEAARAKRTSSAAIAKAGSKRRARG